MNRYSNKVCLVTGGTTGIGYEIAKRMQSEGGKVIVCSVEKDIDEQIQSFSQDGRLPVEGMFCDVTKSEDRAKLISYIERKYGKLDVLVLNAGITGYRGTQLKQTEAFYDQTFNVNVKANFFFIKESLHLLQKGEDANILVTSSITGINPNKLMGVYAMSKASVNNMVTWLAQELRDDRIRINAVAPSLTRTNMMKREIEMGIEDILPKGTIASPDEIASVVCMICSKDGSFVNGETFAITNGYPKL